MTIQKDLSRLWAFNGESTDPGTSAYAQGWVVEIPTYQEFNYILQGLDKNLLALAEQGNFTWQADINYVAGTKVYINNLKYTCITNNINNNPTTDTTNSYWVLGDCLGGDYSQLNASQGFLIKNIKTKASTKWDGNELTLVNTNSLIALNAGSYNNWLLGNVQGSLVTVNTGLTTTPDGRDISLTNNQVYKIYHEGFKPVVADVANALVINPVNNKTMGRYNSNWVEVVPIAHLSDTDPHGQYLKELDTPSQVEAEAGLVTTVRAWSALRVKQAIHALGDLRYKPISAIDVPTGTILTGYYHDIPTGFIEPNGAILSRTTDEALWNFISAINAVETGLIVTDAAWLSNPINAGLFSDGDGATTFRIPDTSDLFTRLKSATRGLGSYEADEFKSHNHYVGSIDSDAGLAGSYNREEFIRSYNSGNSIKPNTSYSGGTETRPKNVALKAILKR